uniref:Uncharacterized protein n=1 Tax=Rhizophora mucronata TaxID=61149 RepID=A0A2P2NKM5_RHIMU
MSFVSIALKSNQYFGDHPIFKINMTMLTEVKYLMLFGYP